jgi:hypothetical protein
MPDLIVVGICDFYNTYFISVIPRDFSLRISATNPRYRPKTERVKLTSTKLYDFCDPTERAEWLDILIALIEYLRSGESKVGFLNKSTDKNMLHKLQEDAVELQEAGNAAGEGDAIEGSGQEEVGTLRRSSRKRGLASEEAESRDTKVRRRT